MTAEPTGPRLFEGLCDDAAVFPPGNLPLAQAVWVERTRYGATDGEFIRAAWSSEPLRFFRWFAELPAFDGEEDRCAYFVDLRFDTPGRGGMPFRYGACRDAPGSAWRLAF